MRVCVQTMGAYVCTHAEPDLFARSKLPQLCGGHIELLAHVRSRPTGHGSARCCCAARVLRKRYGVLLAAARMRREAARDMSACIAQGIVTRVQRECVRRGVAADRA